MIAQRLAAGFLAGASGVASFFTLLLLFFFISGVGTLMSDTAAEVYGNIPFGEIFGLALGRMLATVPRYYWSARWGALVMGCLGSVLALVDTQRRHIARPWRDRLGLITTAGIIVGLLVGWQYVGRAGTAGATGGLSDWEVLCLWGSIGMLAAMPVWVTWSWWFGRWSRWLHIHRCRADACSSHAGSRRSPDGRASAAPVMAQLDAPATQRQLPAPARLPHFGVALLGAALLLMLGLRLYPTLAHSGPPAFAAAALVGLCAGLCAAMLLVTAFELAIATNWSDE